MLINLRPIPKEPFAPPKFHPVLNRIYASRGITHEAQLDKQLSALLPFHALMGIDTATRRLVHAITHQQRMLIVGDFDADGATSSALAVAALRSMGALHVDFLVPNRFEFGYGLTPGIIGLAKQQAHGFDYYRGQWHCQYRGCG